MKNPGLSAFAAPTFVRSPNHPLNFDPAEDDPFYEEGENDSDYVPPVNFGRWREHGQTARYPFKQGPPFKPGETPEDVIHGEIISPAEQDGADKIIHGEHDSDVPSENPYVEHARQDLQTTGSSVAVKTLSDLLSGAHPDSMSAEAMQAAHAYLSRHFTGVSVNPRHGTLHAESPAGAQLVRRNLYLPAVPEAPKKEEEPNFTLTNKHGTFDSNDPERLVRTMLAFQIMHNEIAAQKKKDEDDDQNNGISSTSAVGDFVRGIADKAGDALDYVKSMPWKPSDAPGYIPKDPKPHETPPTPFYEIPPGSVFEAGRGTDENYHGRKGGFVALDKDAPSHWFRDSTGVAYSPGHEMNVMLDPVRAREPQEDPYHPGHTFTYSPDPSTGHVIERHGGGSRYYVNPLHPAARHGLDIPARPRVTPSKPGAKLPKKGPVPPRHQPPQSLPPTTSAAQSNDLCPVCASGYLEPYDREFHECLNCGSLVKHVGFEKQAAWRDGEDEPTDAELDDLFAEHDRLGDEYDRYRKEHGVGHPDDWSDGPAGETRTTRYERTPDGLVEVRPEWERDLLGPYEAAPKRKPGGLGRGLKQIMDYEGDPLNLGTGGSENPDNAIDLDETQTHHPLHGEENQNPDEVYQAPKRILDKQAAEELDNELDEHLGKFGYQPVHKPGQARMYIAPLTGTANAYTTLTEGTNGGWVLSADHVPARERYTQNGEPMRQRSIPLDRHTTDPRELKQFRQPLADPQNRTMASKSILASGMHPVDDDHLNRAIRDVAQHGRNSATYQKLFDTAYEPAMQPASPTQGEAYSQREQRRLRGLSSVSNPGLTRFVS